MARCISEADTILELEHILHKQLSWFCSSDEFSDVCFASDCFDLNLLSTQTAKLRPIEFPSVCTDTEQF